MPQSRTLLKSARLFHLYSGVFLAPALLFFAVTGGLQTFSYHETTRGSTYKPPAILVKLGQLHKKQTLLVPDRKEPPPSAKPAPQPAAVSQHEINLDHLGDHTNQQKHDRLESRDDPSPDTLRTGPASQEALPPANPAAASTQPAPAPQKKQHLLPMKIFFLITAIGLFFSTLTGLFMSYKYTRSKTTITATLAAGIVIPIALLLLE